MAEVALERGNQMVLIPCTLVPVMVTRNLPPLETGLVFGNINMEIVHGVGCVTLPAPGSSAYTKPRASVSSKVTAEQALNPPPPHTTHYTGRHPIPEGWSKGEGGKTTRVM
jgi:hypothetical protein